MRYLSFNCHFERRPHSGNINISIFFNIAPLNSRFKMLNLKFLFKLLHNLIDCPELLERINFNENIKNSRDKHPFLFINYKKHQYKLL